MISINNVNIQFNINLKINIINLKWHPSCIDSPHISYAMIKIKFSLNILSLFTKVPQLFNSIIILFVIEVEVSKSQPQKLNVSFEAKNRNCEQSLEHFPIKVLDFELTTKASKSRIQS